MNANELLDAFEMRLGDGRILEGEEVTHGNV